MFLPEANIMTAPPWVVDDHIGFPLGNNDGLSWVVEVKLKCLSSY